MASSGPVIYLPSYEKEQRQDRHQAIQIFGDALRKRREKKDTEEKVKAIQDAGSRDKAMKIQPPSHITDPGKLANWNRFVDSIYPEEKPGKPTLQTVFDVETGAETKVWIMPGNQPPTGKTFSKPGKKEQYYGPRGKPKGDPAGERPSGAFTLEEVKEQRLQRGGGEKPTEKAQEMRDWLSNRDLANNTRNRAIARNVLYRVKSEGEPILQREYMKKFGDEWSFGEDDKRRKFYLAYDKMQELVLAGKSARVAAREGIKHANTVTGEEKGVKDKQDAEEAVRAQQEKGDQPSELTPVMEMMKDMGITTGEKGPIGGFGIPADDKSGDTGFSPVVDKSRDTGIIAAPELPRDPKEREEGKTYTMYDGRKVVWRNGQLFPIEK